MNINLQSYLDRISSLGMVQLPNQGDIQNQPNIQPNSQDRDSYIPSMAVADTAIPTFIYNSSGVMVENVGPDTNLTIDSSSSDFMSQLQDTFRANADSIQRTLDELGLSLEDLYDEDNMNNFASAMNEGAARIGVPQVENLDEAVANLLQNSQGVSKTTPTETSGVSSAQGSSSEDSATSDDDTSIQTVIINGMLYREITTTENGVEITTRELIGAAEEA